VGWLALHGAELQLHAPAELPELGAGLADDQPAGLEWQQLQRAGMQLHTRARMS